MHRYYRFINDRKERRVKMVMWQKAVGNLLHFRTKNNLSPSMELGLFFCLLVVFIAKIQIPFHIVFTILP
jgi:hypothetical protein